MASERPALPLPRRPARRVVSTGSTVAGPSTSTPVQTHTSRSSAALSQSFTQEPSSSSSNGSINGPRLSFSGLKKRSSSESPLILELDQHNNSSIALSPRTAPRRPRTRSRRPYNDSEIINGDASLAGAAIGETSGLQQPGRTAGRSGRRVVSTPLQRQHVRHARGISQDPSFVSASTASTSGILGINGSLLEHTSSSPVVEPTRLEDTRNGGVDEDILEIDEEEEEEYYSDGSSGEVTWELVDRMRVWRNDALNQHLYSTAIFWGSKVFTKTRNPNDGFWLAQAYFAAGMYSRAERVLVAGWQIEVDAEDDEGLGANTRTSNDKGKQRERQNEEGSMNLDEDDLSVQIPDEPRSSATERGTRNPLPALPATAAPSQASTLKANGGRRSHVAFGSLPDDKQNPSESEIIKKTKQIRLTDTSVACRYLAAQAMVRQEKWSAAMEMLGEVNPFGNRRAGKGRYSGSGNRETGDGGIKFEASMCHLRGLVQLHLNAAERAKECFMEALSIDVKCYDSFEALVSGNMMDVNEEWSFIQGLSYKQHTPEDADFIRMMYTIRLRKFDHREEMERCGRTLMDEYGLSEDPDVLFGLADELYCAMRYADCYQVTSKILETHDMHAASLTLHLACMHHLPHLRSKLFLIAHELVDREPDSVISWYAVGLWYYSGKRWEESRRYFGKGLLLDNRFGPAWIAFAHSFALEGEHDQAITAYSTAQRHFQGSHLPVMFIGMQYLLLSNIKAAHEYLDASYAICQTDPLILNEMGVVNYYMEDYDNALAFFTAALHNAESMQTSPGQWATTHLNMGHAYRKLKNYEKAINCYRRTLDLNPQNATAHSAIGSCYAMLGNNEEAILSYHEALAIHPGESTTTALLKLVLQDAVDTQTRDKVSKNHTMKFPLLSDVVAEDLDARLVEEEEATFGKVLRIDANEKEGSISPRASKHKRGGKGTKAKSTPGRSSARRTTAPTSEARQYEHSAAMDDSQDMSIQNSSPNGGTSTNATPLPHVQAHYGYGGGNPTSSAAGTRRMTRASTAHTGQYAQRQRGESEFESQGENVEQDEPTDRSYAGSDMID